MEYLSYQDGSNGVRALDKQDMARLSSLSINERQVFMLIKASGNRGTWLKDIRIKSGLHQQVVQLSIKSLEKQAYIKGVKSVKAPTKKLYMVFDVEPSQELTGGAWYTDDTLDVEFIDQLSAQLLKFVASKVILLI